MQRLIDLTLSILATILAMALSWPYFRSFSYFAESGTAWVLYFILGGVMGVIVFMYFFRALRFMFHHEGHHHEAHDHHDHDHDHDHDHGHDHSHDHAGAEGSN